MSSANRLLIVDDEPEIASVLETIAGTLPFEVRSIGESEFEQVLEQFRPTVICLDITMPGRDGWQLVDVLSGLGYQGKVVIMSGDQGQVYAATRSGKGKGLQLSTLPKPFGVDTVLETLQRLLN